MSSFISPPKSPNFTKIIKEMFLDLFYYSYMRFSPVYLQKIRRKRTIEALRGAGLMDKA